MCSSGLEALSCPFSTKFLSITDLRIITSPAIDTYTLLQAGVIVVRVPKPLSVLNFTVIVRIRFCLLGSGMAFLKFFSREGIFLKQIFSGRRKAYSLCSFGLRAELWGCKMCMLFEC